MNKIIRVLQSHDPAKPDKLSLLVRGGNQRPVFPPRHQLHHP